MSLVAAFQFPREDSWDFPLFVHIVGAVLFAGGVFSCAAILGFARGDSRFLRLGYWTLVAVALPGYIVLRVGAEWINSKEGWDDVPDDLVPDWLDIGYIIADLAALLLLLSLIAGGVGVYRMRDGKGTRLLTTTLALSVVMLAASLVAVWAMAGKPG
jgi:hypothetical protein